MLSAKGAGHKSDDCGSLSTRLRAEANEPLQLCFKLWTQSTPLDYLEYDAEVNSEVKNLEEMVPLSGLISSFEPSLCLSHKGTTKNFCMRSGPLEELVGAQ